MYILNTICSIISIQAHRFGPDRFSFHRERMGTLIERELRIAINDGIRVFRIGMNMGADIWAAERILKLRDQYFPDLTLHCYLPCETQANHWPEHWREPYFDALARADDVIVLQGRYSKGCIPRRNLAMLDGSRMLLAVHDNVADSGISRAVSYAESNGIEALLLRPFEGPDAPAKVCAVHYFSSDHSESRSQTTSTYSAMFSGGKSAIKRA